jgi:hypothetical protein
MAFDVSALAAYTEDNASVMLTSLVTKGKTASMIYAQGNLQAGIKSAERIGIMDTDALFQAGGSCGFNASGSTTFTQRTITVGKIKVHEKLCPKDMEAKYLQKALTQGSQYTTTAFASEYLDKKNARIQSQLEKAIWQGDTIGGDMNYNKFDGFLKLLVGTSYIDANATPFIAAPIASGTGITASNVVSIFDAVYKAIPTEVLQGQNPVAFCGFDTLRTYTVALRALNLFHYVGKADESFEIVVPGTNLKVVAVAGLDLTNKIVATDLSNMWIGTDLAHEEERYELFWAKEADELRYMAEWKMGVQWAFPTQVTYFK